MMPKHCNAYTYAQAMAAAWMLQTNEEFSRLHQIRVRTMLLQSSWRIEYGDENEVTLISDKP
jgi:hypothetical protein